MTDAEEPLPGGRSRPGVVRLGDTVRRPLTQRSPFVHRVLDRAAAAGVAGVPRLLGIDDQGREILEYQHGETGHGIDVWTDDQLDILVGLVRRFHDALAGSPEAGDQETVCHHDIAPWNLILSAGVPVGLIDFDDAAPGARVEDLGYLAWVFLGLGEPGSSAGQQSSRLRLVCESYRNAGAGLTSQPRIEAGLIDAVLVQHERILDFRRVQAATSADPGTRAFEAGRVVEIEASRDWIRRHRSELEASLR